MATRVLKVTLTVAVRDMTEAEYDDAGGASAEELLLEDGDDPKIVVEMLEPNELAEIIESALESENNPELLAGSGLMVIMGAASVQSSEWVS